MSNVTQWRRGWRNERSQAVVARGDRGSGTLTIREAGDAASRRRDSVDAVIFWLFLAALGWVPFSLGSNSLQAWGVNAMVFPGLAIAYEVPRLAKGLPHPVALKAVGVPALLFAVFVVWIAFQSTNLAPHALHNPIWSLAQGALGVAIDGRITIDRDLTRQALVRLLTSASVFWLALQFCRDAERADRLFAGIAVICSVYAAYGLFSFAVAPGGFLSSEPRQGAGFVSSTFYNRNNFATYAGIGVVVIAGLLLRLYRRSARTEGPLRLRIAAFIETTGRAGAIHISGLLILIAALLLSGSRGGILSTALGCFILIALVHTYGRNDGRNAATGAREIFLLVTLIVLLGFAGFGDVFLDKVGEQGLGDDSRLAIYRLTAGSILASPLTGYGYGTFADVFPMFRDRSVDTGGVWLMAHNTYLEVLQGAGGLFGGLLVASVGLLIVRCILGGRRRKLNATLPAIAGSVGCLVAANALVDFSLQIQAVTLTFMAVLGAGTAQSVSSQRALHD